MTITTSYPGVYVSEDTTPRFSITGSTTVVPAFAFQRYSNQGAPATDINYYHSWQEFYASINTQASYQHARYYKSLYTWFMAGGGKCYLVLSGKMQEAVKDFQDITLVVAAGTGNDIFQGFNQLISSGYKIFGLFDGPEQKITSGADEVMKSYPVSAYGAAFYPFCHSDALDDIVPPSVIAAVCIVKTDSTRGVWKAPANFPVEGFTPQFPVSDELQEKFSGAKALNMIRRFPETGTVIWGARTLEDSANWRFIPVRRLFNMVEKDIKAALSKLIFEPNTQPTWQRVRTAVDNYLRGLWQQGALAGSRPEEAWFVRVGKDITMTEEDITQQKLIVEIGIAASRPAEFIHLKFSQVITR